ncbi:MAG TPA: outer membrane protein assembly factor BamD [Vicinamibacteria bacterium]|nr:outer membrane protein assembly factor BamD [Vicinamibacteria bacterium]
MKRLVTVALALCAFACAGKSVDMAALSSPSDQVVWEAGKKAIAKKEWSSARQYFKRIVDAFPQSEHQADARLATGDSYFEEGGTANYVLAASSYHEFLTLYPQHPRSDYAQFRAAEAYFKQRNSPDRDQTHTNKALEEYEKLLDIYPESGYVEQARGRIHECRQTLARSNYLVGYFYQRGRQAWRSAIGRYETIVKDYPDYDHLDEVLFRYAECLAAAGRYAEALPQIGRLEQDYPQSSFVGEAQKLRSTFPPSFAPAAAPAAASAPQGGATGHPATQPATQQPPSAQQQPATQPASAVPPKPPAADSVVPASQDPPQTPPPKPPGGKP